MEGPDGIGGDGTPQEAGGGPLGRPYGHVPTSVLLDELRQRFDSLAVVMIDSRRGPQRESYRTFHWFGCPYLAHSGIRIAALKLEKVLTELGIVDDEEEHPHG